MNPPDLSGLSGLGSLTDSATGRGTSFPGAAASSATASLQHASPLSGLMPTRMSRRLARRAPWLFAEGLFFTGVGLYVANVVGIPQSGFFAIFLAAAGLTSRFNEILDENRVGIYGGSASWWRVNLTTAFSVLMLFSGVFLACACAALWWGEARLSSAFGFALASANLGGDSLRTRSFSTVDRLLVHNYAVLGTFFALSFVYRAYGALLALCWNACIWAMVLTLLVWRGLSGSTTSAVVFIAISIAAVLPHLLIEAAAYVIGALAAIFLSKATMKYAPSDPIFRSVLRAVLKLTLIAIAGIALGALIESTLPTAVLSRM